MKRTTVLLALAATACGGAKPLPVISPMADVSGHWQLNAQQSDNAAEKIAAGVPGRDRAAGTDSTSGGDSGRGGTGGYGGGGTTGRWGGGGGGGGGYGGGRRGGRGGMRGGGMRQTDAQEIARRRARTELTIYLAQYGSDDLDVQVTPGTVRFLMHGALDTLALKTDGGKVKTKVPQGDDDVQITTSAVWNDGWLVVSRDVDGGGKITETFLRASDGQHLNVVVQLELPRFGREQDGGKPRAIEFRRVYDPVAGPSPS